MVVRTVWWRSYAAADGCGAKFGSWRNMAGKIQLSHISQQILLQSSDTYNGKKHPAQQKSGANIKIGCKQLGQRSMSFQWPNNWWTCPQMMKKWWTPWKYASWIDRKMACARWRRMRKPICAGGHEIILHYEYDFQTWVSNNTYKNLHTNSCGEVLMGIIFQHTIRFVFVPRMDIIYKFGDMTERIPHELKTMRLYQNTATIVAKQKTDRWWKRLKRRTYVRKRWVRRTRQRIRNHTTFTKYMWRFQPWLPPHAKPSMKHCSNCK